MSLRELWTEVAARCIGIAILISAATEICMLASPHLPSEFRKPGWTVLVAFVIALLLSARLIEWYTRQQLIRRLTRRIHHFTGGKPGVALPDPSHGTISLEVLERGRGIVLAMGAEHPVYMVLGTGGVTTNTVRASSATKPHTRGGMVLFRQEKVRGEKSISQDAFVRHLPEVFKK